MRLGRQAGSRRTARASPKVRKDRLDHVTVLDAGDDPKRPTASRAALDVDVDVDAEDASQALCLYALRVQPIALRRLGSVCSACI